MLVARTENNNAKFAIDYVDECNTYGVSTDDDEKEEYVMPQKRPRS